jgi:hypothetical protein
VQHGNALMMFLQITTRCPHLPQDKFLAGLHAQSPHSNLGYRGGVSGSTSFWPALQGCFEFFFGF